MVKKKTETKTNQHGKQQLDISAVLVHRSSSTTRCGTIPRVLNLISTSSSVEAVAAVAAATAPSMAKMEMEARAETNQNGTEKRVKRLPSFISHPNGIVLCVFKRQRSRIRSSSSEPTFICHPNGIVLKVLNQKQSRIQSPSCVVVKCSVKHRLPLIKLSVERQVDTSVLSALLVTKKSKTETHQNCDEQRVKQLEHVKQPQQQYKSKNWSIAIILKLTFVAWDSWTYRIGY